MILTTSGITGTSATPTVTYNQADGTTVDTAGNEVADAFNVVATDQIADTVPPTLGDTTPPSISSAVWDDSDDTDSTISNGDTLTVTFSESTNRGNYDGTTIDKSQIDRIIKFDKSIGTSYTGVWSNDKTMIITITNSTGAAAIIGDSLTPNVGMAYDSKFGSTGNANGEFRNPYGITTNGTHILVVDTSNHRVQIFDSSGNFEAKIGKSDGTLGAGNGEFSFASGITTNGYYFS